MKSGGSAKGAARNRAAKTPTVEELAREEHALELRRAGLSYQRIADEIGYADRSTARQCVLRALGRPLQENADEVRMLELDRLDRLQVKVWSLALQGNLGALDRVLAIMGHRAKYRGLYHSDGIAERTLELEADRIRLVYTAITRAFDSIDLDPGRRQTATKVLLNQLRASDAAAELGEDSTAVAVLTQDDGTGRLEGVLAEGEQLLITTEDADVVLEATLVKGSLVATPTSRIRKQRPRKATA